MVVNMSVQKGLIFLSGLSFGAVISGFAVRKALNKEMVAKEQALEAYYRPEFQRYAHDDDRSGRSLRDNDIVVAREDGLMSQKERNRQKALVHNDIVNGQVRNYKGIYERLSEAMSPEEDDEEESDEEYPSRGDGNPRTEENRARTKIISYDKLGELDSRWETRTLYYYVGNDCLVTEDDEVLDNQEEAVGDCLMKYNFKNSKERLIFVQNFNHSTVYEIQKVWSSYQG